MNGLVSLKNKGMPHLSHLVLRNKQASIFFSEGVKSISSANSGFQHDPQNLLENSTFSILPSKRDDYKVSFVGVLIQNPMNFKICARWEL